MWSFIQAAATSLPDGADVVLAGVETGVRNADACSGVNAVAGAP